jgi:hypothetical protein
MSEALALLNANRAIIAKVSTMPPSNNPTIAALQMMFIRTARIPFSKIIDLLFEVMIYNGKTHLGILLERLQKNPEFLMAFFSVAIGINTKLDQTFSKLGTKLGEGLNKSILRLDQAALEKYPSKWGQLRRWLILPDTIKDTAKVPRLLKDEPDEKCKL